MADVGSRSYVCRVTHPAGLFLPMFAVEGYAASLPLPPLLLLSLSRGSPDRKAEFSRSEEMLF